MLGQMTDAQAITLGVTGIFALVGLVGDYVTTEMCIGKGAVEGNLNALKLMKFFHVGLPGLTFIKALVLVATMALTGTVIGGWYSSIGPAAIGVIQTQQIIKNYRFYKSLK